MASETYFDQLAVREGLMTHPVKRIAPRICLLSCALLGAASALAPQEPPADVTTVVRDNFTIAGMPDQNAQVAQAINASPALAAELHELAANSLLDGIRVAQEAKPISSGPTFQGFTDGRSIVVTGKLLMELKRRRLFDVVSPDDLLPDQTVFGLAHLAHHLRTANAMREALKVASGPDT